MRIRRDLAHFLACEIHDPQSAVALLARGCTIDELFPAVTHNHMLILGVVAKVVGIGRLLDRLQRLERSAVEDLHRASPLNETKR